MSPELLAAAKRIVAIAFKTSAPASTEELHEFASLTTRIPDLARAAIAQHKEIERLKAALKRAENSLRYITNSAQLSFCHEEASAVLKGIQ